MEIADRTNVLLFLIISYTCDTLLKLFLETFSNIGEECERQSEPPAEPADENNLAYIILLGRPWGASLSSLEHFRIFSNQFAQLLTTVKPLIKVGLDLGEVVSNCPKNGPPGFIDPLLDCLGQKTHRGFLRLGQFRPLSNSRQQDIHLPRQRHKYLN